MQANRGVVKQLKGTGLSPNLFPDLMRDPPRSVLCGGWEVAYLLYMRCSVIGSLIAVNNLDP